MGKIWGAGPALGMSVALAWGACGLAELGAFAMTPMVTAQGRPLTWNTSRKFNLAVRPLQNSGLSPNSVFASVVRGIRRWQDASQGAFRFDVWSGTDPRFYMATTDYNGYNNVFFNSQAEPSRRIQDGSLIAYTQVWYDPNSGEILENDLILNDTQYRFTESSSDTTAGNGLGLVFIDTILTHELGHALGLSHSLAPQSTMFPTEHRDQYRLACDDRAGILQTYRQNLGGRTGILKGRIESPQGASIKSVQVHAISQRRGVALATATTDADGNFEFSALEPGTYGIKISPAQSLGTGFPNYFQGYQHQVCASQSFPHQFVHDQNQLSLWAVGASQIVNIGALRMGCGPAPQIPSGTTLSYGMPFAWVDRGSPGTSKIYRFENVVGRLELRIAAMSVFSPVQIQLTALGQQGTTPTYVSESGYKSYDTVAIFENLTASTIEVQVHVQSLTPTLFPSGSSMSDPSRQWVVVGNTRVEHAAPPPQTGLYPFNPKCRAEDSTLPYASPGGDPGKSANVGFCGTVARNGARGPASADQVASWFVPYALMTLTAILTRRRLRAAQNKIN